MTWVAVRNPMFDGSPRILKPACHDRTPFATFECSVCGEPMHLHESQIAGAPDDVELAARCPGCRGENVMSMAFVRDVFRAMRDDGWYA